MMRSSTAESPKGQKQALIKDKRFHIHFSCCYTSAVAYPREAKHVIVDVLT